MKKKVLVLHQSDELKLIALQKEICGKFENCSGVFKKYPLWAELPQTVSAKEIVSVNTADVFYSEDGLFLSVFIKLNSGQEINSSFQLLVFNKKIKISVDFEKYFDCKIKIFRVAQACFTGNSYWLTDSIWKKIKN